MALTTYDDLQASVAAWMNRTDLSAVIPDFIAIAEKRIASDVRVRQQIKTATLTTVAGARTIALPGDFLEFSDVSIGTPISVSCQVTSRELIDVKHPAGSYSGVPALYAIEGGYVHFGPTPDAAYPVGVAYFARLDPLSSSATNALMAVAPQIYLYGSLREAALFTMNKQAASDWHGLYTAAVKELEDADSAAVHSGSALRVRKA